MSRLLTTGWEYAQDANGRWIQIAVANPPNSAHYHRRPGQAHAAEMAWMAAREQEIKEARSAAAAAAAAAVSTTATSSLSNSIAEHQVVPQHIIEAREHAARDKAEEKAKSKTANDVMSLIRARKAKKRAEEAAAAKTTSSPSSSPSSMKTDIGSKQPAALTEPRAFVPRPSPKESTITKHATIVLSQGGQSAQVGAYTSAGSIIEQLALYASVRHLPRMTCACSVVAELIRFGTGRSTSTAMVQSCWRMVMNALFNVTREQLHESAHAMTTVLTLEDAVRRAVRDANASANGAGLSGTVQMPALPPDLRVVHEVVFDERFSVVPVVQLLDVQHVQHSSTTAEEARTPGAGAARPSRPATTATNQTPVVAGWTRGNDGNDGDGADADYSNMYSESCDLPQEVSTKRLIVTVERREQGGLVPSSGVNLDFVPELDARCARLQAESDRLFTEVESLQCRANVLAIRAGVHTEHIIPMTNNDDGTLCTTTHDDNDGATYPEATRVDAILHGDRAEMGTVDGIDLEDAKRMAREALAELSGSTNDLEDGGGGGTGAHAEGATTLAANAGKAAALEDAKRMAREALAELSGGGNPNDSAGSGAGTTAAATGVSTTKDAKPAAPSAAAAKKEDRAKEVVTVMRVGRHGFVLEVDSSITSFTWRAEEGTDTGRLGDRTKQRVNDCKAWLKNFRPAAEEDEDGADISTATVVYDKHGAAMSGAAASLAAAGFHGEEDDFCGLLELLEPELLEIIVSYLPTHHDVLRLSLACMQLNELCNEPWVWHGLCAKMFPSGLVQEKARKLQVVGKYDEGWRYVHTALANEASESNEKLVVTGNHLQWRRNAAHQISPQQLVQQIRW